ncbi:MAG TPA: hypothetical protein VMM56_13010 [Planctomycetaceae bacterium]|nr:hypothetical protein [Planctomycetaceae bacterium]
MTFLHRIGEFVREQMLAVPLPVVRGLFLATLLGLLIWVWSLPKSVTTPPGGAKRWDENLKFGATLALVIQIVIYSVF